MAELKPGWCWVNLGDVVRQVRDKVIDPKREGIVDYVTGGGIKADQLRIVEWLSINNGELGPAFHMRFKPGHTLYKSRVPHGVAVPDREGICANTTFVLEAISEYLLAELLPFLLITDSFHHFELENNRGSTNLFLNYTDIAQYRFALPPLEEQQRLARGLTALEETMSALRKTSIQAQNLKESLLTHMLSYESGWPIVVLGKVAKSDIVKVIVKPKDKPYVP